MKKKKKKIIYISILVFLIILTAGFSLMNFVSATGNDSYTKLLLHNDGANGSTTFTDSETTPKTVTATGSVQISTTQSRFGGSSGNFYGDGANDYLEIPDNDDWNFGSGAFTIDFWMNTANNTVCQYMILQGPGPVWWGIGYDCGGTANTIRVGNLAATAMNSTTVLALNTWYHIALVSDGATTKLFVNGNLEASATAITVSDATGSLYIGANSTLLGVQGFLGYLDEFRVSKGIARWTSNFTPPGCDYDSECGGAPPKVPDVMIFE